MPVLRFPSDHAVGTLEFVGSWSDEGGPLLARGEVTVPDGVEIGLMPMNVQEVDATGGGGWSITSGPGAIDLEFLRDLPSDAITSFGLSHRVQETCNSSWRWPS